jgi:ERCC4-type nuclease
MQTYTILIDSREKEPLPFRRTLTTLEGVGNPTSPTARTVRLLTRRATLPVADYLLEADPSPQCAYALGVRGSTIIERKASADELADNIFNPARRPAFERLLSRMRESFSQPILMLECGVGPLCQTAPPTRSGISPPLIFDGLLRLSHTFGVAIIPIRTTTLTQRWEAGEYVARYLIAGETTNGTGLHPRTCPP